MTLDDQLDHFAVNQRITSKSTVLVVGVKSMIKRKKNVKEEALHLPSSFRRYDVLPFMVKWSFFQEVLTGSLDDCLFLLLS